MKAGSAKHYHIPTVPNQNSFSPAAFNAASMIGPGANSDVAPVDPAGNFGTGNPAALKAAESQARVVRARCMRLRTGTYWGFVQIDSVVHRLGFDNSAAANVDGVRL